MKKQFLCIFVLFSPFLLFLNLFAQTDIPAGEISGKWTKANSPYHIYGEITIPNDSTLTIEPGVEVVFTGHYKFNVQGRLLAIGTETDTILFTINDTTGFHNLTYDFHDKGGWGGIKLEDIASSNDSTIFEYCCFQYGKNAGGGAINSEIDKLRISHCLFRNNMSFRTEPFSGTGGAIDIWAGKPVIEYCEFCLNKAAVSGSALSIFHSSAGALIRNNHFHHNNSSTTIEIFGPDSPIFINNLIEQNYSNNKAIINFDYNVVNAKIINNTIVNNTCDETLGGAIHVREGNPIFINNIVSGNEPSQVYFDSPSSVSFKNCLIEGGKEGFTGAAFTGTYENCIDADPQFVSSKDYQLRNNSPCIGAGYYEEGFTPTYDFEGNLRPNPSGSMPDIGAYENPLANPAHTEISAGDVSGMWTKANSPYNINGEITVPNDSTLSIEPGVEVVFTGHYKFNVQGRLLAIGTETDTIVFTINDTTGFHNLTIPDGGWHGIRFIDTPSNNDSSKIVFCKLQYGKANTGTSMVNRSGGAIKTNIDKLRISHCLFRNNITYSTDINETGGGAIYIFGNSIIEFCEFTENTSSFGAAMGIWGGNLYPLIRNNYFHHNLGHGTIIIGSWGRTNTSPVFINNIIVNNISNRCGNILEGHGIVHFSNGNGSPVLINNTIANNSCAVSGGGVFVNKGPTPLLINNIIYGNVPSQVDLLTPSSVSFYNCLIEGGKEGFTGAAFTGTYDNCIDSNPLFIDEANGDFHLSDSSPCIGAAIDSIQINSAIHYCPPTDFERNPRPNPSGSLPDIGAFENDLDSPTEVDLDENQVPTKFTLSQNYPNPFNPSTTIKYQLPSNVKSETANGFIPSGVEGDLVQLKIYDILGREVATLVNQKQKPGNYEVEWNAHNQPSGVYFYKLSAGKYVETKKMLMVK